MPFKSEAQRERFRQMVKDGKISQETFDRWEHETADDKLPDRLGGGKVKTVKKAKVIK